MSSKDKRRSDEVGRFLAVLQATERNQGLDQADALAEGHLIAIITWFVGHYGDRYAYDVVQKFADTLVNFTPELTKAS